MRMIAIIVVMVLIVIFPTNVNGSNAIPGQHSVNFYNFTSLNPGAYPASNANFIFSSYGNSTGFNATIEPGIAMNGLNIAAQHFGSWSFLKAALGSGYENTNITILFSWNNRLSSSFTGDYIVLEKGSSTLMNISFGPNDGFGTKVSTGSSTTGFPLEPSMNALDRISLYVPENSSIAYMAIAGSTGSETAFPLSFSVPETGTLGNISLSFGGSYCNMTLYNISFNNAFPENIVSSMSPAHLSTSSFSSGSAPVPFGNMSGQHILLKTVNSIIYAGKDGSIYRFNYYNRSNYILYRNTFFNSTVWISDVTSGNSVYFILSTGSTLSIVLVNESTLGCTMDVLNYSAPSRFVAQAYGDTVLLMGYSGMIVRVNLSNTVSVSGFQTPEYTGNTSEVSLLWSVEYSAYSLAEYYNVLNRTLSEYRIDYRTGASSLLQEQSLSGFDSSLTVASYSSVNTTISSFAISKPSGTDVVFSSHGIAVAPFKGNSSTMQRAESGNVFVSGNGLYYEMCSNGTGYTTALNAGQGQYLWFDGPYGMVSSSGHITLFSGNGSSAYSPYAINVSGNSSYRLTGNGSISFSVSSFLPYSLTVSLGASNYTVSNRNTLALNGSLYTNGEYNITARGYNLAGYTSTFRSSLFIDHGTPAFNTTLPANGYVSNSTVFTYSVNWSVGIHSISVKYLHTEMQLPVAGSVMRLATGTYSGPFSILFTLNDSFGRLFHFNYPETAIWNNPRNLSLNMWNGEYLNRSSQTIMWSPLSYVRNYSLDLFHGGFWENLTVAGNQTSVSLGNGAYSISVYARLDNGSTVRIGSATVTVIDYAPSIIIRHSGNGSYSFLGNSANSSLYCNITGNVSSVVSVRLYSPSGTQIEQENGSGFLNFTLLSGEKELGENGLYTLRVRDTGLSNLSSSTAFHFLVNNTIPANEVKNKSRIYTDTGLARIGRILSPYTLTLMSDPYMQNSRVGGNGSIVLDRGTGTYNYTLTVYSNSGNYNTSHFVVFYYTSPPMLNFTLSSAVLRNTPTLHLSTRIRDPVPLASVTVSYGSGHRLNETPVMNGYYNITFGGDGNYTVNLTVGDYCSNSNTTSFSVYVSYYPLLESYSISSSDYALFQDLGARLSGIRLSSMNETWYVNGVESGKGNTLLASLPLGFDNVTLVVSYGNTSVSATKTIFSTGPYLPAAIIAIIAAIGIYRRYSGSDDPDKISEFISGCNGLKVKSVLKLSRKAGLKRKSVAEKMESMVNNSKAEYAQDPDGEQYFRINNN